MAKAKLTLVGGSPTLAGAKRALQFWTKGRRSKRFFIRKSPKGFKGYGVFRRA